jgi:uncharacterized alpha/beta hydrolase family protein
MKKALFILVALLISAAFVTAVFAQSQSQASETKPAATVEKKATAKPKTHAYWGTVASIDAAAKVLVVKTKKGEKTFEVAGSKWRGYKSMDDVKAGQRVTVRYMEKEGKMVATIVTKHTTATKKK